MTVLGAMLMGPDHAVLWADTDVWVEDHVAYRQSKLTINPILSAVGAGSGTLYIADCASRALRKATDPDKLPKQIAAAMRTAFSTHFGKTAGSPDAYSIKQETYVVALWSPAFKRVVLWHFDYSRYFEPIVEARVFAPELDGPQFWQPANSAEIVAAARRQNVVFRGKDPTAGGALTLAEVRRGTTAVYAVESYDADADTRAHPSTPLVAERTDAQPPATLPEPKGVPELVH